MDIPIGSLEQFCEMEIDSDNMSEPESTTSQSTPSSSADEPQSQFHEQLNAQEMDEYSHGASNYYQASVTSSTSTHGSVTASGSATRRHTVGPGDVAYEQSLSSHPQGPMINFKFGGDQLDTHNYQQTDHHALPLPTNLPTLENQPLTNFSMKNHNLLKPPTVMENSKLLLLFFNQITKFPVLVTLIFHFSSGTFGRRASDGGANLQIYYPTTSSSGLPSPHTANASAVDASIVSHNHIQTYDAAGPSINEANEEIQGYGASKSVIC